MKKNILLQTNSVVCAIITIGFIAVSIIGYQSNSEIFMRDVEHVTALAADGIFYKIDKVLSEPVNVSLTMANDNLLKKFLLSEGEHLEDDDYVRQIRDYLHAYREKYGYDSVFLVSAKTNRYYYYDGLSRILMPDDPENIWYYDFLKSKEEYSLNVDNDKITLDNIAVFVNCKITDTDGSVLGVIGVGLRVDTLQGLLREYDKNFDVSACLIDDYGFLQLSSEQTGYERQINLLQEGTLLEFKDKIVGKQTEQQTFWYSTEHEKCHVVSQYVPGMKWHLIVANNMTALDIQLHTQLYQGIGIIALIILLVIVVITKMLKKFNAQIIKQSVVQTQDYQKMLEQANEGIYENIFEIDITHNRGGEKLDQYFVDLGLPKGIPYDQGIREIAGREIKEEYQQNYLELFLPEHVLCSFQGGVNSLNSDFLMIEKSGSCHWVRITTRIFYWEFDGSIRMISYRKNIDAEKKRELQLIEKSQTDSLTGLYNKGVTEDMISQILSNQESAGEHHALLLFDIDNFKQVNDQYGHSFGDTVITEFASEMKNHFRDADIVGRIGGDEFAVLMVHFKDTAMLRGKMERFCSRIAKKDFGQIKDSSISCSIGAVIYPDQGASYSELFEKADQALYYAKDHGKCSFWIFGEP